MKDAELIAEIKRGEYSRCARKLYAYFPVVKKYILTNSGNKEDAEDIFQDALVILFKKAGQATFELKAGLNTFLFGIARNLWFEELKKRGKQAQADKLSAGETGDEGITRAIEEDRKIKRAAEAIMLLGHKCRELLARFYFKKQNMRAIAAALDLGGEKAARDQKYRCLQKAKEIYLTLN